MFGQRDYLEMGGGLMRKSSSRYSKRRINQRNSKTKISDVLLRYTVPTLIIFIPMILIVYTFTNKNVFLPKNIIELIASIIGAGLVSGVLSSAWMNLISRNQDH